ncbi:iron-containing alcohol dehydrogenase [Alphaproteobacteria bacterium]|nr:iron-containing alcohol dehydrogenase [Alphaproteobacteria bacterium]
MKSFQFNTTAGLRVGSGRATDTAPEVLHKLGKKILFITDPGLKKLGLIDKTIGALKENSEVIIFDRVEADPSLKTLMNVVEVGKDFEATGVIGFGGGSSMDVAKLCALLLGSNEDIEKAWGVANAKGPRLPLVLYPTTAGTGSEVTPISIITVGGDEKKGVSSPVILPDLAILDPNLTIGLPPYITAATGIDAMVHAIEGYASKSINNNIMSKMLAKESLNLLGRSIKKAVFKGDDIQARTDMLLGSMMAGMAFGNSPVAGVHALAYPLGGTFHIPHGLSNSLVLPHVLRFNIINDSAAQFYAELAPCLFPKMLLSNDNQDISTRFIENLASLSKDLGLEQKLRGLNIPKEACKKLATDAMKQTRLLVNNPREITEKDAYNIYKSAW